MSENSSKNTLPKAMEQYKWKEGESGNPLGRPKKEFSLTEGMREFLREKDPEKKLERKDILIQKTFSMAQRGDISAIKLLWNYLEGMPQGAGINIDNRTLNINYTQDDLWAGVRALYKQSGLSDEEFLNKIR